MSTTIRPWLRDLISGEIKATLHWKQHESLDPKIKPDPAFERFSDDDSNFRSEVVTSTSQDFRVQLVKVLSASKPVSVLLSDGGHVVYATLDEKVVRYYEEETDEEITTALKGDIFLLKLFTVMTTPYGTDERHVQLRVSELQYAGMQRKIIGAPRMIHADDKILDCIKDVMQLRTSLETARVEQNSGSDEDDAEAIASQVVRGRSPSSISHKRKREEMKSTQVSDRTSSSLGDVIQTQMPVITSSSKRLRPSSSTRPTLEDDGIETLHGTNLDTPYAGGYHNPQDQRLQSGVTTSSPKLSRPVESESTIQEPTSRTPAANVTESSDREPSTRLPTHRTTPDSHHIDHLLSARTKDTALAADKAATSDASHSEISIAKKTALATSRSQHAEVVSSDKDNAKNDRPERRIFAIPDDQQALLDKKTSWMPPLPGQTFPHPNVPIAILTAWNNAQIAREKGRAIAQPQAIERSIEQGEAAETLSNEESEPSSYRSRSWSVTPPPVTSPPERRDYLPPDSSGEFPAAQLPLTATFRPSTAESIEESVPRAMGPDPHHRRRSKFLRQGQREKWLVSKYGGRDLDAFDVQEACAMYHAKFDNDPITQEEMKASFIKVIAQKWSRNRASKSAVPNLTQDRMMVDAPTMLDVATDSTAEGKDADNIEEETSNQPSTPVDGTVEGKDLDNIEGETSNQPSNPVDSTVEGKDLDMIEGETSNQPWNPVDSTAEGRNFDNIEEETTAQPSPPMDGSAEIYVKASSNDVEAIEKTQQYTAQVPQSSHDVIEDSGEVEIGPSAAIQDVIEDSHEVESGPSTAAQNATEDSGDVGGGPSTAAQNKPVYDKQNRSNHEKNDTSNRFVQKLNAPAIVVEEKVAQFKSDRHSFAYSIPRTHSRTTPRDTKQQHSNATAASAQPLEIKETSALTELDRFARAWMGLQTYPKANYRAAQRQWEPAPEAPRIDVLSWKFP